MPSQTIGIFYTQIGAHKSAKSNFCIIRLCPTFSISYRNACPQQKCVSISLECTLNGIGQPSFKRYYKNKKKLATFYACMFLSFNSSSVS